MQWVKCMPDVIFHNTSFSLIADVRHGQAILKGKLDTGSPISVFNLAALSIFLGVDEGDLKQAVMKSQTAVSSFKGFNGIPSDIYLCDIHNIYVGHYLFDSFRIGVSLDYPIGKDGRPITKILLGMDVFNCGEGVIGSDGNIEFSITKSDEQKKRMLDAFGLNKDDPVLVIDEI